MRIIKTKGTFEFLNPYNNNKELTNKEVPFIIDWDYNLVLDVNEYLLCKTLSEWNCNSNTPISNSQRILCFLEYCFNIKIHWSNISHFQIRSWVDGMLENGQSSNTVKAKFNSIKSLFDWSFKMKKIKDNPFLYFEINDANRQINKFSNHKKSFKTISNKSKMIGMGDFHEDEIPNNEELKLFLTELNDENRLMAITLASTGMRKEELQQLTIGMIKNMPEVNNSGVYKLLLNAQLMKIKNNKSRTVIVNKKLKRQLIKFTQTTTFKKRLKKFKEFNPEIPDPYLCISSHGRRFSADKLNKAFNKASYKSGYLKTKGFCIHPHTLRHIFATYYLKNKIRTNTDIESAYLYISERLGHSSPTTTKTHYVKIINRLEQDKELASFSQGFLKEFF